MRTTTFALAFALALPVAAPLVASGTALAQGATDNRKIYKLQRAGSRRGAVCAYYKGRNDFDEFPLAKRFAKRACFQSAAQCRNWLYKVQTAFPRASLTKRCGRA